MKKLNWRYAIGEILLIFIGITLAIGFQNWNEQNKQSKLEKAVLSQLKTALKNDLKDVDANTNTHTRGMNSCQNVLNILVSDEPISDEEFIKELMNTVDYTFLVSDVSTYEYLKSVGLHIIENDKLRREITNLYDVVYEGIYGVEKNAKPLQIAVINGAKKYYTANTKYLIPIVDVNSAKNDHELRFDLKSLEFSHKLMLKRYQEKVKPNLEHLMQMVETQLN